MSRPHQTRRLRITYHVQSYVHVSFTFLTRSQSPHVQRRVTEGRTFPRTTQSLQRWSSSAHAVVSEAGEVGVGIDNGPRYWGTGEGRLELEEGPLQTAWYVIASSVILIPRPPKLMRACATAGSPSTTHTTPSSVCSTPHMCLLSPQYTSRSSYTLQIQTDVGQDPF